MSDDLKTEALAESLKQYLNTHYKLSRLEAIECTSVIGAGLISKFFMSLILFIFLFFLSFGFAFYISDYFGNAYSGFLLISGFYFILGMVYQVFRNKAFIAIRDSIIRKICSKKNIDNKLTELHNDKYSYLQS
jgi:hypothetical protein